MNLDNERRALGIVIFSLGVTCFIIDPPEVGAWKVIIIGLFFIYFGLELLDIKK